VLVEIPHLTTPQQERREAFRQKVEWATAAVLVALIIAGNLFTLRRG
jgi:hypothetical protein